MESAGVICLMDYLAIYRLIRQINLYSGGVKLVQRVFSIDFLI